MLRTLFLLLVFTSDLVSAKMLTLENLKENIKKNSYDIKAKRKQSKVASLI